MEEWRATLREAADIAGMNLENGGMDNLIDKCLLTITQKILMMHQLHQDMGRYIVQQQSSSELGKCRLLGCHEDSFNVLRRKIVRNMLFKYLIKEESCCLYH
ncbi:unnamed protein product [Camellia sinensis]